MRSVHLAACIVFLLSLQGCTPSESVGAGGDNGIAVDSVAELDAVIFDGSLVLDSASAGHPLPGINPTLPVAPIFDGPSTLEGIQHDLDMFSWESFIALNWPAKVDGTPDINVTIGEQDLMGVWQFFKESRDIFLPGGAEPPPWSATNPLPESCEGMETPIVIGQLGKIHNVLDEGGEVFQTGSVQTSPPQTSTLQTGPLIDQNGQYARFEVLTNEVMFNYILDNQLYSKTGQQNFGMEANFPFGTNTAAGSIMIKAAWKVMGDNDEPSRFHTSQAYIYDNPHEHSGVKAACKLQNVGLVGLHIATKAKNEIQWIWSTFEHVDNVPTQGQLADKAHYNFYQPNCGDCAEVNTPPPRPWNPAMPQQPSQIERVTAIDEPTRRLNASYQAALMAAAPGSVWANYELVSTQWATDATNPTDPTGIPAPTFLANSTLETYMQGSVPQMSSGCIQCHNNAAMTTGKPADFTYLLQRAQ